MAEERESWNNHCEFFLTSLGLAVGLGNVWRFPYVCFDNGGASFLIPYILMLFVVGLPAMLIELSAGQYARVGANKVFGRMVPAFKGLGYGMLLVRFFVNVYYVIVCAWAFFYLFVGFTSKLPWADCGNLNTNTIGCYDKKELAICQNATSEPLTFYNSTCMTYSEFCSNFGYSANGTQESCINETTEESKPFQELYKRVSPSEDYFNRVALGITYNYEGDQYTWEDFGTMKWELVGCLALIWVLVIASLFKGVSSLGKASYVITLAPYFVLTAFLAYMAPRDGAVDGMKELFNPDWSELSNLGIWSTAASQIFFSLSVGYGGQLALSSYNQFHNNCNRDAFIVGICNSLTSVFAGLVVFAILGNLAGGDPVDSVVTQSTGLAFIAIPEATLSMDVPPLWSFLFFFMMINLALSSICSGVQTFMAFILDERPELTKHRLKILIGSCSIYFLLALPMCFRGGMHLFKVFDSRCSSSLLLLSLIEMMMIAWVYGCNRFLDNITEMFRLPAVFRIYWRVMWSFVSPLVLALVIVLKWVDYKNMEFKTGTREEDVYLYPAGVQALGWIFELAPTILTIVYPLWVVHRYRQKGYTNMSELFHRILQPSDSWEKTSGSTAINEERINTAFSDPSLYTVTPPSERKSVSEDVQNDTVIDENTMEKRTEL